MLTLFFSVVLTLCCYHIIILKLGDGSSVRTTFSFSEELGFNFSEELGFNFSKEVGFNFSEFSGVQGVTQRTVSKVLPVKVKSFSSYSPSCAQVSPNFHGAPREHKLNKNGLIDAVKWRNGGTMETFSQGMVLIRPFPAEYEARCSVWSPQSGQVMAKAVEFGYNTPGSEYVAPPGGPWTPHLTVSGPHVFFLSWFTGNYGHFLVDHMPSIAWLREQVSSDTRFLLLNNALTQTLLKWFDVDFYNRIEWISEGQLVQVKGDLMVLNRTDYKNTHPTLISSFHRWSESRAPFLIPGPKKQTRTSIVYYSRGGQSTFHGRVVDKLHEQEILKLIRQYMKKHHRSEELVVFDGYLNGTVMSFQQQYELMQSASVLIGPHGAGMCNSVFLAAGDCAHRPKMLEFTCGWSENCLVQDGGALRSSYFLQASAPWLEYHQVKYDATLSTERKTFVDLDSFELALDVVLGGGR